MQLPQTFNSWLVLVVGIGFLLGGLYCWFTLNNRLLAVGMVMTGIGWVLMGLTDGFTDPTPRGKLFFRLAIVAFMVGVPLVAYHAYRMM